MNLRSKIISGYVLALGIAVIGTTAGLGIGNHYGRQAIVAREQASSIQRLLSNLEVDILTNRPAKELSPYLQQQEAFRRNATEITQRLANIEASLSRHNAALPSSTLSELQPALEKGEKTVTQYMQKFQTSVAQIDRLIGAGQIAEARQVLLALVGSQEFSQFIGLADQLRRFNPVVAQQEDMAKAALERSEVLRNQITITGLLLSIAIAALLSLYLSQAITRPIKTLTQVAQQVTETSNFELQVPITTQDEVGILTHSLNHLIQSVRQLLQEKQVAAAHLVQTEKMSSLGQLVAGVAHEINNPVNFIHGNLAHADEYTQDLLGLVRLYRQHYPDPPLLIQETIEAIDLDFLTDDLTKLLESMRVGTDRIHEIVKSLRNFSRLDEAEIKEVNLHEGIDNTLTILHYRLKARADRAGIQVIKNYGDLPLVECYAGQLNQVFMNILSNAIDALESHQPSPDSPLKIQITTQVLEQDWALIQITDNGPGMNENVRTRLFDPFFTTKPVGKGTGLGLSISHQVVTEKHGGILECYSEPNQGAEFRIKIPIQQFPSGSKLVGRAQLALQPG
ncbi:ATP-binding protein [Leptolyngbya sp. 'hensonii']|uniref:sensor histidine kinase n=1 Tax=Leptolyngbya sp. 'hensonii' TaxID=1922337 RepID=UPI000A5B5D0E